MSRMIKPALLWTCAALGCVTISLAALMFWPDPLFAYSLQSEKIIVASDRPIPAVGGERVLHDCERLLERSPLKAEPHQYRLHVTNARWRQRLFFLPHTDALGMVWPPYLGGNAF